MSDAAPGARPGPTDRSAAGRLLYVAVALGTSLLAAGILADGLQAWAAGGAIVPAVLWAAARRRHPEQAADASLAASVALAGLGLWLGVGAGWMVPAVATWLIAWDLARLGQRLALAGRVEGRDELERRHLVRLLPVVAAGLVLALVSAYLRLDLGFLPALLLGALAIAGLACTVAYLQRDNN
ncbi:MAG: hypothetical protein JXA93_18335 [Anaerolineae bacterium]|nr:hypothetical protein [Anaerolineae bacterium]